MEEEIKEGTQIIYVPIHISLRRVFPGMKVPEYIPEEQVGRYLREKRPYPRLHSRDLHIDCEAGFVTSVRGTGAFCRYWSKHDFDLLRTMSGSERTSIDKLLVIDTRPQKEIDDCIKGINKEKWKMDPYEKGR